MNAGTLEVIHSEFVDWRRTHRHGPYPVALRRRALVSLAEGELIELGTRLGLTVAQIRRWGKARPPLVRTAGGRDVGSVDGDTFYEVKPSSVAFPMGATPPPALEAEVCMPNGSRLRLRGAVDAALIRTLVQSLQQGVES